ncbi:MAG TPA: efflux RND transporter periplasmic adaptor subunit, partial [Vicinamibacterales bacterium]
ALAGAAFYSGLFSRESAQAADQEQAAAQPGQGGQRGGGAFGGRGRGGFGGPLTVEVANAQRSAVKQELIVVGNLIGDSTVAVVPRAAGRLEQVYVQLGDRVSRGQRIAKIEDQELVEQIRQAEAAMEVASATIRQREADLQLARTNVERSRSLFERQLLPKQTLDDNEARYQSAVAALDLARAQNTQSNARLEELRVNMANTVVSSPVNGFVARRAADPGAFVSQNAPVADVVDISRVRMVANVVEKDLRIVELGDATDVAVDAFPEETFTGRIARIAPVLDPATRTFPIEIEIPNPSFRLKPGMYARVGITVSEKPDAIVVPTNAVVDVGGKRGVFLAQEDNTAAFRAVEIGIENDEKTEIVGGLAEGDRVVTTGAAALNDGDRFVLGGEDGGAGSVPSAGRASRGGRDGLAGGRQGGGRRGGPQGQGQ